MHFGGACFDLGQDAFNGLEFQLEALRKQEETLLAKIKGLEEQNVILQNTIQELSNERSIHISGIQALDLSRISGGNRSSEISGSLSFGESKECRYLSEFLTEMLREHERIHLRPGDELDSQERIFETKVSFSKKAIQNFLSGYKKLETERNELLESLKKHSSQSETNLKFSEINPEPCNKNEFYDCRIIVDSLFSLLWPERQERWQIKFRDYADYEINKEQVSQVVAAVGNENVGKSFVTSQILGHPVPQGKHQRTVGIGALYPHKDSKNIHCIALDTPGTNVAVRAERKMRELKGYFDERNFSEAERLRRLYGDTRIMESLLHEFVMKHAEILLVVVDKLGRDDQQFINSMKERNRQFVNASKKRKENSPRKILIIHNLSSCTQIKHVKEVIQKDIKETHQFFERLIGKKNGKKICVYEENTPEGVITHIIMAHEGTLAGDMYNNLALEYIRKIINSTPILKKFDLVKAFKEHLETHIENHLYTTMGNIRQEEIFSLQRNIDSAPSSLFLNNARTYDLKNSSVDEIGILKTYVQGRLETVPYVMKLVQITREEIVHNALQIEFEVCGNCREQPQVCPVQTTTDNGTVMTVTITALSEDNGAQRGVVNVIENTRSFGRFRIETGEINLGSLIRDMEKGIEITDGNSGLKTATIFLTTIKDGWS